MSYLLKSLILVSCDARFCCESGIQGDQKCKGKCIQEIQINDGIEDCKDGCIGDPIGDC